MVESKIKEELIIKDLEKINSDIEQLSQFLMNEDKGFSEILCKVLSFILLNIEYPIIEKHPSLHPDFMIGEKYKNYTFKLNSTFSEPNRENKIKSKIKAAFVIKELERISFDIEQLSKLLMNEDKKSAKLLCEILSVILFDIEGPIIRKHPSLRPVVMLGKKYKNCAYRVVKYDKNSGSSCIVEKGVLPKDSSRVLAEIENKSPKEQDSFFCLELEDCL